MRRSAEPHFLGRLRRLPEFDGPFDAFKLAAAGFDGLMASYPTGTEPSTHTYDACNVGVITQGHMIITTYRVESRYGVGDRREPETVKPQLARAEEDTADIEFWSYH